VTQSNAATAEESAAAAEELNAQAEVMKRSVAELLQIVGARETSARETRETTHARPARPGKPSPSAKRLVPANARPDNRYPNGNGSGHAAPALASRAKGREAIPMEGDFKDF